MNYLIMALLFLGIAIVIFLLLREVSLWYFKINTAIQRLSNIELYSQKQAEQTKSTNLMLSILIAMNSDKKIVAIAKGTGAIIPVTTNNIHDIDVDQYDIEVLEK